MLVDVGTGFYVEKDTTSAAEFYEGKIKELATNIQGLEGIVQAKTANLRVVEEGKLGSLSCQKLKTFKTLTAWFLQSFGKRYSLQTLLELEQSNLHDELAHEN